MSRALTVLWCGSFDDHPLSVDKLKGIKMPTEELDLSQKQLGSNSATFMASCIKANSALKELECAEASASRTLCVVL